MLVGIQEKVDYITVIELVVFTSTLLATFFNVALPLTVVYVIPALLLLFYIKRKELNAGSCKLPAGALWVSLFFYELMNPYFSINPAAALYSGLFVPASIFMLWFTYVLIKLKSVTVICCIFSAILLLASIIMIGSYLFFITTIQGAGWELKEIIPLRYLLMPMGMLINDWGLLFLLLLPFPLLLIHKLRKEFQVIPIVVFFIGLYASILTFSRGAYLSVFIFFLSAFILVAVFKVKISVIKDYRFLLVFFLFMLALYPIKGPFVKVLPVQSSTSQEMSVEGRLDQWERCIEIFKDYPLQGVGANGFKRINKVISNKNRIPYTNKTTNSYFQILVEKGLIGFFLYLSLFIYIGCLLLDKLVKNKFKHKRLDYIIILSLLLSVAVKEITFSSLFDNQFLFLTFGVWIVFIFEYDNEAQNRIRLAVKRRLIIIALMIVTYFISISRFCEIKNSVDLNEKAVHLSFTDEKEAACDVLSGLDTAQIEMPVPFSNLAIIKVLKTDLVDYDGFAKGENVELYTDKPRIDSIISLNAKAIEQAPCEPLFLLNQGWLYIARGENEKAIAIFDGILKFDPDNASGLLSLGLCYEHIGKQEEALDYYTRGVVSSPYLIESRFFRELKQRHPLSVETMIENALSVLENDKFNWINQSKSAKLYLFQGKTEKSKHALINLINHLPNLNRAWLTLGDIYRVEGDLNHAQSCYQKAHMLDPYDQLGISRLYDLCLRTDDKMQQFYMEKLLMRPKFHSNMTNHFKNAYLYRHIAQETFPFDLRDYFSWDNPVYSGFNNL